MQDHFIYVAGFDEPFKIGDQDREVVRQALTEGRVGSILHVNVHHDRGAFIIPLKSIVALEDRTKVS